MKGLPMDKLLLHATTKLQITQFINQPSHTIALVAAPGAGKGAVATRLAAELLSLSKDRLESHPYFKAYKPENGTISIETARDIISFTKLKTTGDGAIRRVIIIEDAHAMTIEAQNALLKTLEEPPIDTVILLTLVSTTKILPTILSRVRAITLQPIEQSVTESHFLAKGHDTVKVRQYYFMSGGLPGLMHALLTEDGNHPLTGSIQKAKTILQSDSFERLVMVEDIVKQKQTEAIVQALCTISRSALYIESSRTESKETALRRWASVLKAAEGAKQLLSKNAQAKLVLTSLFLEI